MNDKKYILEGTKTVECTNLIQWAESFENDNRIVAQTSIGKVKVSTVFLGIDHSFGGDIPLLFETLIFGGSLNSKMKRYETWEQAELGHKEMVKLCQNRT